MNIRVRDNFEWLSLHPKKFAALFPAATIIAILTSIPFTPWTHHSLVLLLVVGAGAMLATFTFWIFGDQLPDWTLHLIIIAGVLFVSALIVIQPGTGADFHVLYIWIAVFAALYFRPSFAAIHLAIASVAYATILLVDTPAENPVMAWMSTIGTAAVLCFVVIVLVGTLRRFSSMDPLTRLANRRSWDSRVDEEFARAQRNASLLSLVVIDINDLKVINDHHGHDAGDQLIRDFATGWRDILRNGGDFIARLGGDEFGLLAPGSSEEGVARLIDRLREVTPHGVTCSFGAATWDGVKTAAELFREADEAMYSAKRERHVS